MSTLTMTTCPECAGRGKVGTEQAVVSCPRCQGAGMYLVNEQSTIYQFVIPPAVIAQSPEHPQTEKLLRYLFAGGVFIIFALSVIELVAHASSPEDILWHQGWYSFTAGLSGLATMYTLSRFEHHQASLHALDTLPDQSSTAINLFDYANPRVFTLLEQAAYTAAQTHNNEVTDEIFLTTLLSQPRIQLLLARLEEEPEDLVASVQALIGAEREGHVASAYITPTVRQRLYTAFQLAQEALFPYIDLEDILLAYLHDPQAFAAVFEKFGLTEQKVYVMSRWYAEDQERSRQWGFWRERGRSRPKGFMNRAWTALPTPLLDRVSTDITRSASNGGLVGTTARPKEVQRVMEILGSTEQNNPILVGEPGVGKTAILNTLALQMLSEKVPEVLKDKRLVQLDVTALLTDGTLEDVQAIVQEVIQAGNVILAIPDLQVLATSQEALNPATVLTNALKQHSLQVISTATYADYHQFIEANSNLSQLITLVEIAPATAEQALVVLEEKAPALEAEHQVLFTFSALAAAIQLAEQFLPDLAAPSGALALLGEAASSVKVAGGRWVKEENVQIAVEKRTSVPVRAAGTAERENLLNLEADLHKRVIGQEQAITAVATALRRARAGFGTKTRPIASFLFVGPTGVGKTETAKAVGELLFGEHGHFIRLDMSEYQDNTAIYRLIGAPGEHTEGGELTQAVREHPYSLILLDEIEKADPSVLDLFLQLLEDGRLTENTGRTVHFQNSIIVATSNAASREIIRLMQEKVNAQELPNQVLSLLQQHFKPEFLNRFDGVIPFESLTPEQLSQVVTIMLADVIKKGAEQGITLQFDQSAIQKIAELGYDPQYGARPLRRVIQSKVEGLLANLVLAGSIDKTKPLQITGEMIQ